MKYIKLFENYTNSMLDQRKEILDLRNKLEDYFKSRYTDVNIKFEIMGEYPEEYLGDYIQVEVGDSKTIITNSSNGDILIKSDSDSIRPEKLPKTDFDGIVRSILIKNSNEFKEYRN